MPYKSDAQRRFFHSAGAKRAGISPSTVKEFDQASKGMSLPERKMADGGVVDEPNSFKLVDEGDTHFVVEHPQTGQQLPIAKNGLSPRYQEEIRNLPKTKADEQTVNMALPNPQDYAQTAPPLNPQVVAALQPPQPSQINPAIAAGLAGQPTPLDTQVSPLAPVKQSEDYFNKEAQLQGQLGQAQSEGFKQVAAANVKKELMLADANQWAQDQRKQLDDENTQLTDQIKNGKVDPTKWWNDHVTTQGFGTKLRVALGFILGGLSTGGRGQNPFTQIVDNMISRDIDAQKSNLDKTSGLLRMNLQKTQNLDAAVARTYSQIYNTIGAQIDQFTANTNSKTAQINGQIAKADILNKGAIYNQEYQRQMAIQRLSNKAQGLTGNEPLSDQEYGVLSQTNPTMAKQMIRVPTFNPQEPARWVNVPNEDIHKSMSETLPTINTVNRILNRIQDLKDRVGRGILPFGDVKEEGENLATQLKLTLKDLGKSPLRIGEFSDSKYLDKLAANFADFRQKRAQNEIDSLRSLMKERTESYLSAGATTYNPAAATAGFRTGTVSGRR